MLIGRLAPSPTGRLHLGHARSFLLGWWHVRSRGGRVLLRHEDLDQARARRQWVQAAEQDLRWLGLDWDGEPQLQSDQVERIHAASAQLLKAGLAYPCICSRGDIRRAHSAPHGGQPQARYPGTCRGRFPSLSLAESHSGQAAALRFYAAPEEQELSDGVYGRFRGNVQASTGDFVIERRDHQPAYQLAVVVDDAAQGVTEVLRGDDLLPSTLQQRLLQRALGYAEPKYFHVPLVLDASGLRLAKRHQALSLQELRERGVDPRAVVAWAARSAGQDTPTRVSAEECLAHFDLARLPLQPVRLEPAQLVALCSA